MGTGWHFYQEGVKKFHDPGFSSTFLFESATGPWASFYHGWIPDPYGRQRLELNSVRQRWEEFTERAKRHYRWDESEQTRAEELLERHTRALATFFQDHAQGMDEYFLEVERLEGMREDPAVRGAASGRQLIRQKESELRGQRQEWLSELRGLAEQYEEQLYELSEDARSTSLLTMADPTRTWLDWGIKYVITGIGVCLILGLATRLAALGGIGFLVMVMGTQPPWVPDASLNFFYYQMVEVLALCVLVAFAAGRYAGLDFVLAGLWDRCCPGRCCGIGFRKGETS